MTAMIDRLINHLPFALGFVLLLIATTSVDKTGRIFRCAVCGSLGDLRARAKVQLARG